MWLRCRGDAWVHQSPRLLHQVPQSKAGWTDMHPQGRSRIVSQLLAFSQNGGKFCSSSFRVAASDVPRRCTVPHLATFVADPGVGWLRGGGRRRGAAASGCALPLPPSLLAPEAERCFLHRA